MDQKLNNRVYQLLQSINLDHYWENFTARGYDGVDDLLHLDDSDMALMHIEERDRTKLLEAVADVSEDLELVAWLEKNGLGHYHDNLRLSEYNSVHSLVDVDLSDAEFFRILEMDMPGHRKRLIRAVQQLQMSAVMQLPKIEEVAKGYWGKPDCLKDSKHEFLCIKAEVESTKAHKKKSEELEFMVDSGSDVVTLREDILQELDLQFLQTVYSVGIHAAQRKDIYQGRLKMGDISLEVEVMPEKYNSIGNQTLKCFHHFIFPTTHIWMQTVSPPEVSSGDEGQQDHVVPEPNVDGKADGHTDSDDIEMDDETETNDVVLRDDNHAIHGAQNEVSESMEVNQNDPKKESVM